MREGTSVPVGAWAFAEKDAANALIKMMGRIDFIGFIWLVLLNLLQDANNSKTVHNFHGDINNCLKKHLKSLGKTSQFGKINLRNTQKKVFTFHEKTTFKPCKQQVSTFSIMCALSGTILNISECYLKGMLNLEI